MATPTESDEDLLRRVALQRDQSAFRQLVERHKVFGITVAVRVLRDELLAEEALQDAFLRVWRSAAGFKFDAKFTTWFYKILYNVCLSRIERRKGEVESEELPENLPAMSAEYSETIEVFNRTLEQLPEKYRSILTFFYLQELTYDEIAEVMSMPLGTVKTQVFRGRELLKRNVFLRQELLH